MGQRSKKRSKIAVLKKENARLQQELDNETYLLEAERYNNRHTKQKLARKERTDLYWVLGAISYILASWIVGMFL